MALGGGLNAALGHHGVGVAVVRLGGEITLAPRWAARIAGGTQSLADAVLPIGCCGERTMEMVSYYAQRLAAERLKLVYDLAPPAVQHFLTAEIEHVRSRMAPAQRVLDLGCGYGRVMERLASAARWLVGIDTSMASLAMARHYLRRFSNTSVVTMDAAALGFPARTFDLVCCLQNGISAFHVDQRGLLQEAFRVTKPGGKLLFSSYSAEFWEPRLEWFRIQSAHGLIGEIDDAATVNGAIVTRDGFTATTVTPEQFLDLSRGLGSARTVRVVARSSVFCEIIA